jgi:HEPN domain-containing protein
MSASLPKQWLDKASEDLVVARLLLGEGHLSHSCFLPQQCMEKSLKAFLIFKVNRYPRTHSLTDLLNECESLEPAFSPFLADCTVVDQYYIPTRYLDTTPGGKPSGLPTKSEADEAVNAANKLFHFIAVHIP